MLGGWSQGGWGQGGERGLVVPPSGTGLGALTHRRGGQGLAAHELRWPHAAKEVTELRV